MKKSLRRRIFLLLAPAIAWVTPLPWTADAAAAEEQGMVASYTFAEGAGDLAGDQSGNGNDGRLSPGVSWVTGPFGSAIELDGKTGFVDCGKSALLDLAAGGTVMFWFKPLQTCQGGLLAWTKGPGLLNQRLVISLNTLLKNRSRGDLEYKELAFLIADGVNADRPFDSNFHEPYFPPADAWLFYAVTFDGRQVDIYRDGLLVCTRFQTLIPDLQGLPLWLGRCAGTGGPSDYFKGLLDEVRLYNRPLTEQGVYQAYQQTATGRDKDETGFGSIAIKPQVCPKPGTIFADLDYRGLSPLAAPPQIKAELANGAGKVVASGPVRLLPVWGRAEVTFNVQTQPAGTYTMRVSADHGKPASMAVAWPGRAKGWENVKVLNNLCWELLSESPGNPPQKEYPFVNPRRGWVYFTTETEGDLTLSVVAAQPALIHVPAKGAAQEAMRWLEMGPHTIAVAGTGALKRLVVRSTATLALCHYPHVGPGTGNDHEFLARHCLADVNTLITGNYGAEYNTDGFRTKWTTEMGRSCIEELYTAVHAQPKMTPENAGAVALAHLTEAAGMTRPDFRGVMLDEFDPGDDEMRWVKSYYDEWSKVVDKVLGDPAYAGRLVIPWFAYNMFDFRKSTDFLRVFVKHGSYLADEVYLDERDTESRAWLYINEAMADLQDDWERTIPGVTPYMFIIPSYLQREFWNPAVDFKVYMEMQIEHLATRPEFFGLAGIGWYQSHAATEEYVRWGTRLGRHYGLEGHTERLGVDPYNTAQIRNPDFVAGTADWTLTPAETGSMAVRSHKGYGLLQGRYPYRAHTETPFLWMKRSQARPNVFAQEIRNLTPGRLYQVKMHIGDGRELAAGTSQDAERAVDIRIENGDLWNDWYRTQSFKDSVYTQAGYQLPPFSSQNYYYFKVPHLVFRAKGPTARLVISDWKDDSAPDGPVGQELIFNNIDVHPYLEP